MQNAVPAPAHADVEADASAPHGRAWSWVAFALVLVLAGVRFYRAPSDASARLVVPDGEQYAVAAERFATFGRYDIEIEGRRYPPIYPPFFSVALLSHVYRIAPGEIGNGIVVVWAFGLLAVGAAYAVGHRFAGPWGGALAGLGIVTHPMLRGWARTIMSDVPTAAMFAAGLALFLRLWSRPTLAGFAAAGLAIGVAAGLRQQALALLIPFPFLALKPVGADGHDNDDDGPAPHAGTGAARRSWRRRAALVAIRLAALLVPPAVALGATFAYNHRTFGAWHRSGYHFWCPLPFDYPHLTFKFDYLFGTLRLFRNDVFLGTIVIGAAALAILAARGGRDGVRAAVFIVATALPVSVFQAFFHHAEERYHAALLILLCIATGAALGRLTPAALRLRRPWAACALLAAALAGAVALPNTERPARNRQVFDRARQYLPHDAAFVTNLGEVVLDPTVLRGTRRRWIAIDRRMAYADLAVSDRPIDPRAVPMEWPGTKHRDPRLMAAGLRDVVAWTANERPDLLADLIRAGTPTMLDAASIPPGSDPYKRLAEHFEMTPIDPDGLLMKLTPREE